MTQYHHVPAIAMALLPDTDPVHNSITSNAQLSQLDLVLTHRMGFPIEQAEVLVFQNHPGARDPPCSRSRSIVAPTLMTKFM